ncbi:MAG: hypothetical protein A4E57_03963 [Syntrophorhabdaceae bacterium PtaU1.Bin034]|jgi:hypothetical protein|nr:MAG: hypothetical protein A4E57_03963 [Syntrophorhabdaceae bacterium PtaU1.Bin034]
MTRIQHKGGIVMEEKPKSVEDILKMMEQGLGKEPRPMVLM